MAKVKVKREGNLLWEDECQPLTNEQMNDIKSQFHPSNTANVQIIQPPYSPDEHIVTYWREYRDGVLMQKPMYEKTISSSNVLIGQNDTSSMLKHNVENIEFGFVHEVLANFGNGWEREIYFDTSNTHYFSSLVVGATSIYDVVNEWSASANRAYRITFRYTKSSDEWTAI